MQRTVQSSLPVTVSGVEGALKVTTGSRHACALLGDGTVKCWGSNYWGSLGIGYLSEGISSPAAVLGVSSAVDVVAHGLNTCALLLNGNVKCWGPDQGGYLENVTSNLFKTVSGY